MSNSVTMTSAKQAQLEAPGKPPFKNMVWIPGGTFLTARMAQPIDTSTCHLGFRCIVRPPRQED